MFNTINKQTIKSNSLDAIKALENINDKIYTSDIQKFINFVKEYNIFQNSNNEYYKKNCEKIKKRLNDLNIPIDDVQPGI